MASSYSDIPHEVIEDGNFESQDSSVSDVTFASIHSFSVFEDDGSDDGIFDNFRGMGGVKGDGGENTDDILGKLYLGCGFSEEIEKKLSAPGTLGLYHRQSGHSVEYNVNLFLHIVFCSSSDVYKHLPIDILKMEGKIFYQLRGVQKRHFDSVADLVSFYQINKEVLKNGKRHFGHLL